MPKKIKYRDANRKTKMVAEDGDERTNLPLFFADPELVECAQAGENTSPKPSAVSSLCCISWCVDFDLFADNPCKAQP